MEPDTDCVFCEIVAHRSPASRVYEDEAIVAFMTLRQIHPGELLVIPKLHVDHFHSLPDDLAIRLFVQAQRLSRVIHQKLRPQRVGLVVHGFGVRHAHLVVVPLQESQDITSAAYVRIQDGAVTFGVDHIPVAPRRQLDEMAALLREPGDADNSGRQSACAKSKPHR